MTAAVLALVARGAEPRARRRLHRDELPEVRRHAAGPRRAHRRRGVDEDAAVLEMCGAIEKRVVPRAASSPIVAIDGPAGAGKSTVARRLADALGFVLVDTGAMYRTVALAAKRAGIAWTDGEQVGELARSLVARRRALASSATRDRGVRVRLDGDGRRRTRIRAPDMGMGASTVSAHKAVRDALLEMQRQAGRAGGVVLEGRDIGTVVFPDAEVKFFLTARPRCGRRRRFDELVAKGAARDLRGDARGRAPARRAGHDARRSRPLRQAADATAHRQLGHLRRRDRGADGRARPRARADEVTRRERLRARWRSRPSRAWPWSPAPAGAARRTDRGADRAGARRRAALAGRLRHDAGAAGRRVARGARSDKVYGPLLRPRHRARARAEPGRRGDARARRDGGRRSRSSSACGRTRQNAPGEVVIVVRGVRANVDPAGLVDAEGHALWGPGPPGAVRELVRVATSGSPEPPIPASLFELAGAHLGHRVGRRARTRPRGLCAPAGPPADALRGGRAGRRATRWPVRRRPRPRAAALRNLRCGGARSSTALTFELPPGTDKRSARHAFATPTRTAPHSPRSSVREVLEAIARRSLTGSPGSRPRSSSVRASGSSSRPPCPGAGRCAHASGARGSSGSSGWTGCRARSSWARRRSKGL